MRRKLPATALVSRRGAARVRRSVTLTSAGAGLVLLSAGCGAAQGNGPAQGGGDGAAHGTVTGRFVREGGPLGPGGHQPAVRPLRGLIDFLGPGRHVISVRVGRSGTFTVSLSPGSYRAIGRSPEITQVSSGGNAIGRPRPCSPPVLVTVISHRTVRITVACVVP